MTICKSLWAMDVSSVVWGWDRFFEELRSFVIIAKRQEDAATTETANYFAERFSYCVQVLSSIMRGLESARREGHDVGELYLQLQELQLCCRSIGASWVDILDRIDAGNYQENYRVPTTTNGRGRPKFDISKDQLVQLRSLDFGWKQIADILGVSRMTVYRRRQEFLMLESNDVRSDVISDGHLRQVVTVIRERMPNSGEALVAGRLRSMGYQVPRHRIREVLRAIDPLNTALRWTGILTNRRPYAVAGPNSLWHIGKTII